MANDLCADAIAYAWENWDRVRVLDNPVGYLYRVATSRARRYRRWRRPVLLPAESGVAAVEPDHALHVMLAKLPLGQRTAVVLVHVYGWSYHDVADLIGRSLSDVRNDVHRGLPRCEQRWRPVMVDDLEERLSRYRADLDAAVAADLARRQLANREAGFHDEDPLLLDTRRNPNNTSFQ